MPFVFADGTGAFGRTAGFALGIRAGGYDYTETYEGSSCPTDKTFESTVSVKLDGDEATNTNGVDTLIHCTLAGCKCTLESGNVFEWSGDSFEQIRESDGCTVTSTGRKK